MTQSGHRPETRWMLTLSAGTHRKRDKVVPSSSTCDQDRMNRRDFIAGTAALLVSPECSWAQGTPRRVGYLDLNPKNLPLFKVWLDSVRDHGWIEGKNLIIDYRSAEGHAERLPALAAELTALKPDLIVGPSPQVVLALKS